MDYILNNIKNSIDLMATRIQKIENDQYSSRGVDKEIEKLKQMKILDEAATKTKRYSMTIDLRKEKSLRDSWRSALDEAGISNKLREDESYKRIISSRS